MGLVAMICLNGIALKYAERSRSVQLKKDGNQNSPEILRLLFGLSSEKIPFFRSRSEEDPNMIRRNGFSNRSKPVKSSQNRSEFFMMVENGHFCGNFNPFIKKHPSKTSKKNRFHKFSHSNKSTKHYAERSRSAQQSSSPTHQSSIINHQPSTINHQPSTINHQPSTINHQQTTNRHSSTFTIN
ncbi:hypothetical protein [Chryseobacterium mucoviscidosis]|uniref:hypothetical protein n=1 Tax=Chryseobacterium mucoviscidosis TaxID=1945581 RepID=UPI0013FDC698|nr:hypothetical protein [Chryseobacterium mucoviscidosis]